VEPEERQLLERIAHLTKENNLLLQKMRQGVVLNRYVRVLYWIIIIGLSIWGYYLIQPYISTFENAIKYLPK
jgi:hypothetical protein